MNGYVKIEFFDNGKKYYEINDHNVIVDNSSAIMSFALANYEFGINTVFIGDGGTPLMNYEGTTKLGNQVAFIKINSPLTVTGKSISFTNLAITIPSGVLSSAVNINEFALGYSNNDEQIIFNYKYLATPVTVNPGGTIKIGWTINF